MVMAVLPGERALRPSVAANGAQHPGLAVNIPPQGMGEFGAAQERFRKKASPRPPRIAADHPQAERIAAWFRDKARAGQTGRRVRR
jgi:hypothetical protein